MTARPKGCHSCPHGVPDNIMRYAQMPYAQTPCATCPLGVEQRHQHIAGHVSLEAMYYEDIAQESEVTHMPFHEWVDVWKRLTPGEQRIIEHLLDPDVEYNKAEVARRLGISRQAITQAEKRINKRFPGAIRHRGRKA